MADNENLFAKSKVQLVLNHPFFGVLVCHLPTEPMDPAIMMAMGAPPTAMVDGKKIYYNAEWVKGLPEKQRMGLLCHEILHPALQHLWRRGQREPETWNRACDYVVNDIILNTKNGGGTGFELPPGGCIDGQFSGMSVEQVYHLLKEQEQGKGKKKAKEGKVLDGHLEKEYEKGGGKGKGKAGAGDQGASKKDGKGKDGKGKGQEKKDGQGNGSGAKEEAERQRQEAEKKAAQGQGKSEEKDEEKDDEGENDQDGETPNQQQEGEGGDADSNEGSLDDVKEDMTEVWKGLLIQAAMVAKSRGTLPGQLERLVGEVTKPKVPWQRIIEMYINDTIRDDYDMCRQDRRFIMQGIYFPELQSNAASVVVATDTSGSIGGDELKTFVGEITGILRCRGVSAMRLMACDAEITMDETLLPTDALPENFPGGGGTDFRPVFKRIADNMEGIPPALIVYLTDGYGTFPERDIGIPTIWLIAAHSGTPDESLPKPPFGITVRYDLDTEVIGVL